MFVSSSATAAMLLPIGIGVVKTICDLIQEQNPGIKTNRTKFSYLLIFPSPTVRASDRSSPRSPASPTSSAAARSSE
ncbi:MULTISPECIES: hypothetical protein [Rhodococcus]|uniref:hypothetical protein n=1 Tax=Rhodococcus TaxID=1827 RepID=UPI00155A51B8|nr:MULTISPECIES: hypothetical protein [Rhodococcus]QQZ14658.1 hypothetical protein GO592_34630 [Rhodococcus sp. 21391]